MLEVEVKFRCPDHAAVAAQLTKLGAVEVDSRTDEDHYFNAPDRDFARTDEALRLRRIGDKNFVTYKGPKLDTQTKTRKEIEVALAEGLEPTRDITTLLIDLGYRPVAVVRKQRRVFHVEQNGRSIEVTLDRVDHVGDYVELEIQAPEEALSQAREQVLSLAARLSLQDAERRSYLELLLSATRNEGSTTNRPMVVSTIAETRRVMESVRRSGRRIGLVPTMGALHAGHVSLIRQARAETQYVVVTIFVNPAQFGPNEDLARYPRPLQRDLELCAAKDVDLVLTPDVNEVYPPDFRTYVEVTSLQDVLEGASRPGHFRGVATIVLKLFNIVQPDIAYFGQKDAQQVRIIEQTVRDLNVPVELRVVPTVREPDGLALSSRNQYLNAEQRAKAPCLHQALEEVRKRVEAGERDAVSLRKLMESIISESPGVLLDYSVIVDADTLQPVERVKGKVIAAVAARVGTTRLIDNLPLQVDS